MPDESDGLPIDRQSVVTMHGALQGDNGPPYGSAVRWTDPRSVVAICGPFQGSAARWMDRRGILSFGGALRGSAKGCKDRRLAVAAGRAAV